MKKQDKVLKATSTLSKKLSKKVSPKINLKKTLTKNNLPAHHFKKVKVKRGIDGLGLFAEEEIKKGELIIEYVGNILTDEEANAIPNSRYIFSVAKDYNINGTPRWNLARYCNHSCIPNSESELKGKRVFVRAIKNIKEGEEITYDYGEEYVKEFLLNKCKCGAEKHLYHD